MAHHFLLFAFVFASQVIGGLNTKLPPPSYGNTITILSIDGGGIKGIIPTVVLEHLENALKIVAKDEKAVLADYFDVIAGASTGGLIAAMLASPNPNDTSRPAFTAPEILKFYLDYGPSIFNQTSAIGWNESTLGPKYDGKFLRDKAHEILPETRLHDTLTNVVIPTFDIGDVHPVIFSSFQVKKVPILDAKMSDIAIGTSAAPVLLPPHAFINDWHIFNLIDGAVVASNPALLAVNEVIQELNEKNSDFIPMNANEPTKILLLSLGCGITPQPIQNKITALLAQFLPATSWVPLLLKFLGSAVGDTNEYHLQTVLSTLQSPKNYYLRIEEYDLPESMSGGDNATKENMENLVRAGENLLKEPVKVIDVKSYKPQENQNDGTNAEALKRFAEILYKEKQLRLEMKAMEKIKLMKKMGRPFVEAI